MTDILQALSAPFDPKRISWRVGSTTQNKDKGMALAYIDSRDVQDRLDAVCGPGGWQCRYPHAAQKTVCEIGVKVDGEWIWKADGAGDTDVEQEKGALSDAFKRAAVKWGIGRYLYDIDSPWVAIVQKGKSYVIAEGEFARLQRLLPGSTAVVAKPEPEAPKNGPGVSQARQWVSKHVRDLHAAENPKHFMEILESGKANWVRVRREFPGVWTGPDNSGLKGEAFKVAAIYEIQDEYAHWLSTIERLATEPTIQQTAAE